jgi:hypothetical protein
MTIEELYNRLKELRVSEDRFYLHGLFGSTDDNDKLALSIKMGKYTAEYEVYYKERGNKNTSRIFMTEAEACDYFLNRIKS